MKGLIKYLISKRGFHHHKVTMELVYHTKDIELIFSKT